MLIGRAAERRQIDSLLDAARQGTSGALLLEGEAGVGKSALLQYATDQAGGLHVLATRGVESESEIPFSGLFDLLRPILSLRKRIPVPQAAALAGALALGPPLAGDPFAIFAATFSLLVAAADQQPLLAIVDDVQWLDVGSTAALLFCARRLGAEGIVLLFAKRSGEGASAPWPLAILQLQGLDQEASSALVSRRADRPVATGVAARLFEITRGNPLALIEIPALLSDAQLSGREPIEEPLRAGPSIERAYLGRVRNLPAACRRTLLLAAASESGEMDVIIRATRPLGLASDAIEPAESSGLVTIEAGVLQWRHPLLRAAIYHGASAVERRAAHRALGEALIDSRFSDRRAWHLAAAALAPDETVASALEEAALEARRRNAPGAASITFERAARLSPSRPDRAQRYFEAARDAHRAGSVERAGPLLEEALAIADDPLLRADIQHMRGGALMWSGAPMRARALLLEEAGRIEALDPTRAAMMAAEATIACTMVGDVRLAVETARRTMRLVAGGDSPARVAAEGLLCNSLILAGEAESARPLLNRCRASFDKGGLEGLLTSDALVQAAGHGSIWVEDYEDAARILHRVVDDVRTAQAVALLPFPLALLSELDFRTGRWNAALAEAEESVELSTETGQMSLLAFSSVCLAQVQAGRGQEQACRRNVSRSLDLAERFGVNSIPVYAGTALGLLSLGTGQVEQAIVHLEKVASITRGQRLGEPATVQWGADLIEAYVRAGRLSDAKAALLTFERQARHTNRNWALAAALRGHGLLASSADFEHYFEAALELHRRTPTPFETARTELCLGERLCQQARHQAAGRALTSALTTFDQLGASPWAVRARRELSATGATAPQASPSATDQLTPHELIVALRVVDGASNKEIAAALFLSTKTVEFHLGNAYRKLGLHSRAGLASRLAREVALGAAAPTR
jgi:DNA-binding CsgD family transcriptional regulator